MATIKAMRQTRILSFMTDPLHSIESSDALRSNGYELLVLA